MLDDGEGFAVDQGYEPPAADLFAKAHVKGHVRGDGVYVRPYQRRGNSAPVPVNHPKMHDDGKPVEIKDPHFASAPSTWGNSNAVATWLPNGDAPKGLAGVPFRRWRDHPTTAEGWDYVDGINDDLDEPAFHLPAGKKAAAGVIIEEPDGRVWCISPTNGFGGYRTTFPKGTAEEGLSLQANAIKEAFEESGLKVRITGFIGDFERTTSKARMYRAVRIGGTPVEAGWETQSVHLIPKGDLYDHLNGWADHPIAEMIGAGPAPKPPPPPPAKSGWGWGNKGLFPGESKGKDDGYFKGHKPPTPFPEKKT